MVSFRRKEILRRREVTHASVRAAYAEKDHLEFFPRFRHYDRNGLTLDLQSGCGDKLPSFLKRHILKLLKINMKDIYGPDWLVEEKMKRREMIAPEARYIFVLEAFAPMVSTYMIPRIMKGCGGQLLGFVHYRFLVEEELPVLYVYELQIDPLIQGRGIGMFLMQLIELIALKSSMAAVILTVQKSNRLAIDFYLNKLSYKISSISPSRSDARNGDEETYEILCKVLNEEAKSLLEEPAARMSGHLSCQ